MAENPHTRHFRQTIKASHGGSVTEEVPSQKKLYFVTTTYAVDARTAATMSHICQNKMQHGKRFK